MGFNREKTIANAQKYERKGNYDRAIREYSAIIEADPSDVRTRLKLANIYVKANRFDEALRAYREVAFEYARDDLYEKAAAVYKQALRIAPEDPEIYRDLGECYHRFGRLKDAVRVFHKAQKIFKQNGDGADQRDILERMVRIDPEDVGLKIQLAERYEKDKARDLALEYFRAAAAQLREEGRLDEYVQVNERIIFLSPDALELRKEVVRVYLGRGDNKHALKHLQYCFKKQPQDVETLELLGTTFHRLGNREKALLVYQELATAYESNGQTGRATDVYRTILNLDPKHRRAREVVGYDLADSGSLPGIQDTGNLKREQQEEDALAGIEFLDAEPEPAPRPESKANDFLAFAEGAIRDIEEHADLDRLQQYPDGMGDERTQTVDLDPPAIELDAIEPLEPIASAEAPVPGEAIDDALDQSLTESEVFLKYGLLDRAEDVITRAVRMAPNNLRARDQMRKLLEKTGDIRGAAHQLVEMARIAMAQPKLATEYLQRAARLTKDPALIKSMAGAAGLEVRGDEQLELVEVSSKFIDEVSEGLDEISAAFVYDDVGQNVGAQEIEFLDPDEDGVELLDDDEVEFLGPDEHTVASADRTMEDEPIEDRTTEDEAPMDFTMPDVVPEDILTGVDELSELSELSQAEVVDVDVDVKFDQDELAALEEGTAVEFGLEFSDEDADAMFDELFGGTSEASSTMELGGVEPIEELAEVDFYIQQGMLSEAEEALDAVEERNPAHPGVARRRQRLLEARDEGLSLRNAFGSRSLSRKFVPGMEQMSELEVAAPEDIDNTSLELGNTYREMGLFQEAIEEFKHALDDPGAAPRALYNIALCELELGEMNQARNRLTSLVQDDSVSEELRRIADEKLEEIRMQA